MCCFGKIHKGERGFGRIKGQSSSWRSKEDQICYDLGGGASHIVAECPKRRRTSILRRETIKKMMTKRMYSSIRRDTHIF